MRTVRPAASFLRALLRGAVIVSAGWQALALGAAGSGGDSRGTPTADPVLQPAGGQHHRSKESTTVVVAVLDEGVDVALFRDRLDENPRERINGVDDDGNGSVDDVHGIGFGEHQEALVPVEKDLDDCFPGREDELRLMTTGHGDLVAGRHTPEAAAVRARMASLDPAGLARLIEVAEFYDNYYSHGTHVADLALRDNPAARLLVVRQDLPAWRSAPVPFTPDVAVQFARNVKRIVSYLRDAHVRVVNLSWGDSIENIRASLGDSADGASEVDKRSIARRAFDIEADALASAIASVPDILFVAGAGNSANDLAASRFIPADIDLPNVLAVGAVDAKGDATDFTSYGGRVRIYANGVEVEARMPGGSLQKKTGTSMATPQVTNVAARIIAAHPSLTPPQTAALIVDSARWSRDRKRKLLDPVAAIAAARTTHTKPAAGE